MESRSRSISPSRNTNRSRSPTIIFPKEKSPILLPKNKPTLIPNNRSTSPPRNLTIPSKSPTIPTKNPILPKSPTIPSKSPIFPRSPTSSSKSPILPRSPTSSSKSPILPRSPTSSSKSPILPRSPTSSKSLIPKSNNITKKENDIINMNKPNTNKIHELILKEWQIEWYKKANNILLSSHFYIDTSPMRSGKTFIALKLAKDFDLELMVICPLTTKNYWKNMANKYGIKLFTAPINYESLVRGTKNEIVQLYLEKKIRKNKNKEKDDVFFEPTEAYKNALKTRKILLILDEGQMIKNDNLQHKACNALIQPILTTNDSRSRFGILSGTLIDKPEQIINLFRTIGYIRAPKLYVTIKGSKNLNLDGTQELINVCKQINFAATTKFLLKNKIPVIEQDKKIKEEIDDFCFSLYVEIIKPKVAGAMSAPTTAEGELFIRNGYFHILPEKANQLKNALEELKFLSGYKSKNKSKSSDEEEETKTKKSGKYQKSLVEIEKSKLLDMARVAKKILSAQETNKVIITINYTGTKTTNLEELLSYLTEYDPLVITGKTNANKRDIMIDDFNMDPTRRILIANPKTISVGISLVGDGQRYMLISPSAKLMEIVQLSARVYGDQLKTDSYVYIFYGIIGGDLEANILQFMGTKKPGANKLDTDIKNILEKKSDILGRMQENEIRQNMKLPSDYEDEYEEEDEVYY